MYNFTFSLKKKKNTYRLDCMIPGVQQYMAWLIGAHGGHDFLSCFVTSILRPLLLLINACRLEIIIIVTIIIVPSKADYEIIAEVLLSSKWGGTSWIWKMLSQNHVWAGARVPCVFAASPSEDHEFRWTKRGKNKALSHLVAGHFLMKMSA